MNIKKERTKLQVESTLKKIRLIHFSFKKKESCYLFYKAVPKKVISFWDIIGRV